MFTRIFCLYGLKIGTEISTAPHDNDISVSPRRNETQLLKVKKECERQMFSTFPAHTEHEVPLQAKQAERERTVRFPRLTLYT